MRSRGIPITEAPTKAVCTTAQAWAAICRIPCTALTALIIRGRAEKGARVFEESKGKMKNGTIGDKEESISCLPSEKKRIDIKVGFSCNNHCVHCVQGNKRDMLPDKDTEDIKAMLWESRHEALDVVFTGGEPTIRKDIVELVRYARDIGYQEIQIQSNGRMFAYKNFCREMVAAGANVFVFALLAHKESIHNYITGADSFKQAVKGITNLKALGQRVKINCVVTKANYRHLPETARLFVKLGVVQFQFAYVHIAGSALQNYLSVAPRKSLAMPYIKEGLRIGLENGVMAFSEAVPYCLMNGYLDCIAEKRIPETKIYEANCVIDSYTEIRQNEGKAKRQECRSCIYDSVCEGPWKEYPEIFGWDEFVPVQS